MGNGTAEADSESAAGVLPPAKHADRNARGVAVGIRSGVGDHGIRAEPGVGKLGSHGNGRTNTIVQPWTRAVPAG